MGTIKDRNSSDLTEAKDIKKRWQECTELYKKELHDPDNHDGVITHLEPDILECEVKWALDMDWRFNSYMIVYMLECLTQGAACLGLVHGDDLERCCGEGGGRGFMFGNACKN